MSRVRLTASPTSVGSAAQPGVITATIHGASAMPSAETRHSVRVPTPATARAILRKASRLPRARYSLNTGITALASAPSASRRLSRLGIRKATKKASVTGPAPKARATTMSRT
jgi:hypothetical protein